MIQTPPRPSPLPRKADATQRQFHFLLLPEFSIMGFVSAIEPLRVANRFRADSYRWHILSVDGGPVKALIAPSRALPRHLRPREAPPRSCAGLPGMHQFK